MVKIGGIARFTENTKRFEEIVRTLMKYGLADWIKEGSPEFVKNLFRSSEGQRIMDLAPEVRVRMALTDLGASFVKLGQLLSTRPDLVGPKLAEELESLQADVPGDTAEQIHLIIEKEFARPVEELFGSFDDDPLASASIAQVHRATLKDGTPVVVKVQHEGIERDVLSDLDILHLLAEIAERGSSELRLYQPRALVAEFRRTLTRELDFRREARNLEEFARNFEDDPGVHIPRHYPDLSGRRVLTMERLGGLPVSDRAALAAAGVDTKQVARRGAHIYLDMIFRDGFYHADPHPGNIRILDDGRIALLDFGMAGRLDRVRRVDLEDMLFAAVQGDPIRITETVVRMGTVPPELDRDLMRSEVDEFVADYVNRSLEEFDTTGALTGLTDIIRRHRVVLPTNISLLLKVLVQLEGTSRSLERDFNLATFLKPYVSRIIAQRYGPKAILERMQRAFRDWERLLDILPRDLADILTGLRQGRFDVHLQHRRLDSTANRLVYGLIHSALLLASAIVLAAQVPPAPWGISLWGIAGLGASAWVGVQLWWGVRKSGGMGK